MEAMPKHDFKEVFNRPVYLIVESQKRITRITFDGISTDPTPAEQRQPVWNAFLLKGSKMYSL
jgi:hypothetical protein